MSTLQKHFYKSLVAMIPALFFYTHAQAQADILKFFVDTNVQYDDNIFRLPEAVAPVTFSGQTDRADRIIESAVGMQLDKMYALQRFIVAASITRYNYGTYKYLDYSGKLLNADWLLADNASHIGQRYL